MRLIGLILILSLSCISCANNHSGAKHVLVIGDSISLGYTPFVQQTVQEENLNIVVEHNIQAQGTSENARHTRNGLLNIDAWLAQNKAVNRAGKWDLVTFNFGLHDLRLSNAISVEEYVLNLRVIATKIKLKSKRQVFFTSTGVDERYTNGDRSNARVLEYNAAAVELMRALNIEVYDLWTAADAIPQHRIDGAHFSPEGYAILGEYVFDSIADAFFN